MILFVTGQYAGAQYLHPLISLYESESAGQLPWRLYATGSSRKYWDNEKVSYMDLSGNTDEDLRKILEKHEISLVVLSASAHEAYEYKFILAARALNIPTANFIDTWTNYEARYNYMGSEIYPDYILAIDIRCKEEMIAAGIPGERIRIVGQPYLETLISKAPDMGNHILILGQPVSKYLGDKLGYTEQDFFDLCISALMGVPHGDVHVSMHPDSEIPRLPSHSNVRLVSGSGAKDIEESSCVLGIYSMQMIVAYLWGRRVASVQPVKPHYDLSPLSRWGYIPRLQSRNEIVDFIQDESSVEVKHEFKEGLKGSLRRLDEFCRRHY